MDVKINEFDLLKTIDFDDERKVEDILIAFNVELNKVLTRQKNPVQIYYVLVAVKKKLLFILNKIKAENEMDDSMLFRSCEEILNRDFNNSSVRDLMIEFRRKFGQLIVDYFNVEANASRKLFLTELSVNLQILVLDLDTITSAPNNGLVSFSSIATLPKIDVKIEEVFEYLNRKIHIPQRYSRAKIENFLQEKSRVDDWVFKLFDIKLGHLALYSKQEWQNASGIGKQTLARIDLLFKTNGMIFGEVNPFAIELFKKRVLKKGN